MELSDDSWLLNANLGHNELRNSIAVPLIFSAADFRDTRDFSRNYRRTPYPDRVKLLSTMRGLLLW